MIEGEPLVRGVDIQFGVAIGQPDVGQALLLAERLQLAVAVGDADRADTVALGELKFEDRAAMLLQALGVGRDFHSFLHRGQASR